MTTLEMPGNGYSKHDKIGTQKAASKSIGRMPAGNKYTPWCVVGEKYPTPHALVGDARTITQTQAANQGCD